MTLLSSSEEHKMNGNATSLVIRNYSALSNFKGHLDPDFVNSINPFWLQFPPPSSQQHYLIGAIHIVLMIIGCLGNAFVLFMFAKCKSLRTPASTLVINLALSDFCMLAKSPIAIYNSFNEGPATGDIGCRIYGFVGGLTGVASIATLTAISIDRYNVVVYPLNPLRSTSKWRSRIMIIIVWIYSLTFSSIPALNTGISKYVPEGFLTTCSFDYLSNATNERIFMFIFFVFAWCVPFMVISYCYIHILRVVIGSKHIQSNKNKSKTELKLAAVVLGVIGLWFTAWTPYSIVALLGISGNKNKISQFGSMIPSLFCKTSACIDPYVYAVTHTRFRMEFGKMFLGRRDPKLHSQYLSSFNSRATTRRRGIRDVTENETVSMKKYPIRRDSSCFEETSISLEMVERTDLRFVGDEHL